MERFNFTKINLVILVLAIFLIVVGYIVMRGGDRTVAPVILIISYLVLIPLAFLIKKNGKN